MQQSFLRLPDVSTATATPKSSLYGQIKAGLFPRAIKLGARAVAWPVGEIEAWCAAKIRGATDEELKKLVRELHAARMSAGIPLG